MPQIRVKTKNPFAVTEACDWSDAHDVDNLDVSEPDAADFVTVTLYGISEADERFASFAALVAAPGDDGVCPWESADFSGVDLSRIVAVRRGACWVAHFEAFPNICFFGDSPGVATGRLCDDFAIGVSRLVPDDSGSNDRLLVTVQPEDGTPCPDCRGTGKYVGFASVEPCQRCGGKGTI